MPTIIHPPSLRFNWMCQRPQQMFREFARLGYQAIYCNPRRPNEPRGAFRLAKNLYICTGVDPLTISHEEPRILWISAPAMVRHIQRYRPHLVVYDALDEPAEEFSTWAPYVEELRARADVIFATSRKLYETNRQHHPNVYLCPNGVDYAHFHPALYGNLPRPPDLPADGRPVAGYCGALATWLDWELLDYITDSNPRLHFVFVGPLYNISLPFQKPNMSVLGYRDYRWLPNYLQCFDVCLIPFKITPMTEGCNPIKMYEYLSTGKPVVATPLPEVLFHPEIYVGRTPEEFNQLIHRALSGDSPGARERRIALARENSWARRAQLAIGVIEETLKKKGWVTQND
ncbi:glycosyltransferase family 1 protein [Desulfofundulus sp. TPOSR]|uniref:glycosyltransferase n=1 Tax=Desulfofundulus sp. TPOSR TaxID=2714340 RepID=UPI001408277D|nr:glycosyltransferase [Desulfofundulus sp. TPOSR]NHM26779.1 glycosyltransferase family 1 protein [Desulfofundulus sp. TPOSR]